MKKPTRRSFFAGAGATLAAPLAFAGEHNGAKFVIGRRAAQADANAIRIVQQRYARLAGRGNGEALAKLFANPACASVARHVRSIAIDGDDAIAIANDGTATARVTCIVTTATPIEDGGTLVEMARLQGDGFVACTEKRVLVSSLIKVDGVWKIENVELVA